MNTLQYFAKYLFNKDFQIAGGSQIENKVQIKLINQSIILFEFFNMDIVEFVIHNKALTAKLLLFLFINGSLISSWVGSKAASLKIDKFKKHKVLTVSQALQEAKKQNYKTKKNVSDKTYLIKAKPVPSSPKIQISNQLRSNQYWIVQPGLNHIGRQIAELLNQVYVDNDRSKSKNMKKMNMKSNLQWSISSNTNPLQKTNIKGFGRIVDHQVFKVETKHSLYQNIGFFKRIYQTFAYCAQLLFFRNYQKYETDISPSSFEARSPMILGPVIGCISYYFSFMADRYILIEAKIQDGEIVPMMMSSSRHKILQFLQEERFQFNLKIFCYLILSLIVGRSLNRFFKKVYREVKAWVEVKLSEVPRMARGYDKFEYNGQDMSDDKMCIICYTNCRNTILFDCRHMIMCSECYSAYNDETCPLCKNQIEEQKPLHKQ